MRSADMYLLLEKNGSKGKTRRIIRKIKPSGRPFVIGSGSGADVRIDGDDVAGCHALVVFKKDAWYLCDVSGNENLKLNSEPVIESPLTTGHSIIEVGEQRLELFSPEARDLHLFEDGSTEASRSSGRSMHQVVIRSGKGPVETLMLSASESFQTWDGDRHTSLPAPTTSKWVRTEIGGKTVQQRLVPAQEMALPEKIVIDQDLKKGVVVAFLMLSLLTGSLFLIPRNTAKPQESLDQKSIDIIYNAQKIKIKREESKKIVKAAKARAGGTGAQNSQRRPAQAMPEESQAPKANPNTSQALTSIRNAGLSQLIGKIAKRANKQGVMIGAQGVAPDNANSGRAVFSVGTTLGKGGGVAVKEGSTYRLGGVATAGRGGGVGNVKAGTAIAGGSVGTGNVAMLEEETVVEGGLDKDAIAEVIRRNIGQIRYCYERQLSANPDLYGKVLVRFTINGDGSVAEPRVDNSSLKSSMVEGCMLRRLASWKFPLPKGGTQVRVSYPFMFKSMQ